MQNPRNKTIIEATPNDLFYESCIRNWPVKNYLVPILTGDNDRMVHLPCRKWKYHFRSECRKISFSIEIISFPLSWLLERRKWIVHLLGLQLKAWWSKITLQNERERRKPVVSRWKKKKNFIVSLIHEKYTSIFSSFKVSGKTPQSWMKVVFAFHNVKEIWHDHYILTNIIYKKMYTLLCYR